MKELILKAPAKVNLFLKVLARRPDGYHDIETLFEKLDLGDTLRLKKQAGGVEVRSDSKALPDGKENLAYRAVQLLSEKSGKGLGVRIDIEKKIPIGAGMGGGSSDAAAALVGVNALYGLGLSSGELGSIASEIGADVPLFISDAVWAVGRGKGDMVEKIESDLMVWHILLVPPVPLLSGEAYEWIDTNKDRSGPGIEGALSALRGRRIDELGRKLFNDLEGLSLKRHGLIRELKEKLLEYGARGAVVTGSGPALLGIHEDEKEVVRLREKIERKVLKDKNWQVFIATTLSNSTYIT